MTVIISGDNGISDVDGSAGTPAIRGTDANTGIFFGSDVIGFSEGGTECARFNADAQFVAAAGTASLPVITTTGDVNTGIFFPAADTIAFAEGGAEAMRIDSSGNVGIGTTSPNSQLNVSASTNAQFELTATSGGPYRHYLRTQGNDLQIRASSGVIQFYTGNADGLSSTERARITSSGDFLVGTTNADGRLVGSTSSTTQRSIHAGSVSGSTTTDGVYYGYVNQARGTGFNFMSFQNTSAVDFKILGNGNVQNTNNSYGAISDIKVKENVSDATPKLDDLMRVRVCNYNLIGDNKKQLGVIAQEIEPIFPGLIEETVDRDADGNKLDTTTKSVKYSVFVPMLVKAIQELKAINDAQASRIETLEAKVAALEAK